MKKFILIIAFVSIFLVVLFFVSKEQINLSSKPGSQIDGSSDTVVLNEEKIIVTENNTFKKIPDGTLKKTDLESNFQEIASLAKSTIDEIQECEKKFDDILTVPISEISNLDNESLVYVLEDFDEMFVSSKKLGHLLSRLGNSDIFQKKNDEGEEVFGYLSQIRPCRPFEKVTFINELVRRYKNSDDNSFFKPKIKKSIKLYLVKELSYSSNLSTVNMMANVISSLLTEGVFDKSFKEQSERLVENMENSFDELVDLAEGELEQDGEFSGALVKKEVELSQKYRVELLNLIGRF